MTNIPSTLDPEADAFWWQGSLYRIKARAESTGVPLASWTAASTGDSVPRCMYTVARTRLST